MSIRDIESIFDHSPSEKVEYPNPFETGFEIFLFSGPELVCSPCTTLSFWAFYPENSSFNADLIVGGDLFLMRLRELPGSPDFCFDSAGIDIYKTVWEIRRV